MSTSPFELFRRNLKPLMIALTVLAMLAFVVLPAVDSWVRKGGPGGGDDAVVASYKGGRFEHADVNKFTQNHYMTLQFLAELGLETAQAGGTLNVPGFAFDEQSQQISEWGINSQPSSQASVSVQLYAQRALDLGFDLDHSAVKVWLNNYSDNKFTDTQINQILRRATDRQLGQHDMLEQLRMHLLSNAVQQTSLSGLFASSRSTVPPAQQFALYKRLNERAKAIAYPVLVDDFLADTNATPSDAEIQRVFDEGRELYPDETSDTPGFRKRASAKFEVVSGDFETFISRLAAEVPEEKLREEYDRQVAAGGFVVPESMPGEDDAEMTVPPGEVPPNETDPAPAEEGDKPAEDGDKPAEAGDTQPMKEQPAEEAPAEPAEETPAEETPAETPQETPAEPTEETPAEPAEETPAEPAEETPAEPAEETPAEPAEETPAEPAPESDEQSARMRNAEVQLVAFRAQEEGTDEETPEPPADEPEAPAETPDEPADNPETPAESPDEPADKPEAPAETPDEPADKPETPAETPDEPADKPETPAETPDEPADKPEPPAETPEEPAAAAKPPKVRPFEEVRDQIAEQMVTPDAFGKVRDGIAKVKEVMRKYSVEFAIYQAEVEDGTAEGPAPKRPDIKALAEQYGLTYETLGPHDIQSIQDTDVGQSAVMTGQFQMGDSFPQLMFGGQEGLYSPIETTNFRSGQSFVSWKTEQTADAIPMLSDEVRDEVIAAIRYQEARELARQAAEELATKANATPDKPLEEIVPEDRREFVYDDLGEFPWMLWLGPGRMPMIWNLEALNRVGDDFMRQVFTQPLNEFGVAPNETKSVYYVVKTTQRTPSPEKLQSQFMQATERDTVRGMMSQETFELSQAYQVEFREELGLKWSEDE